MSNADEVQSDSHSTPLGSHRLRPVRGRQQVLEVVRRENVHEQFDDPQNQIRLLWATKSQHDDVLAFEISTFALNDAPTYNAISYTWGDNTQEYTVKINEQDFHINHNCFYALWQACRHYFTTFIWIDSLCIDQNNSAEKSAQVWIMSNIYRRAARVLACVGPHADNSSLLTDLMPNIVRAFDQRESQEVKLFDSVDKETESRLLESFRLFQHRAYWKRLWIIQEIALATHIDVLCGEDILPWESVMIFQRPQIYGIEPLVRTTVAVTDYGAPAVPADDSVHFRSCFWYRAVARTSGHARRRIGDLLFMAKQLECEDLHDRIYGLLGLIEPQKLRKYLIPDYDSSLTQLALRVAAVMPFHRISDLLQALSLDSSCEEIQSLIDQRWDRGACVKHRAPKPGEYCDCQLAHDRRNFELLGAGFSPDDIDQIDHHCWLSPLCLGKSGHLTADLGRHDPKSFAGSYNMMVLSPILDKRTKYHDVKTVMVNGRVGAVVSGASRKGDIIAKLDRMDEQHFLVLRHAYGRRYHLIGRGFMLEGYTLWPAAAGNGDHWSAAYQRRLVSISVDIPPEDKIAFWASELQNPKTMADELARLSSTLTNHPHGVVWIEDPVYE